MSTRVSLDRLRALLAAYGSRPELWPEAERAAALALCNSSEEARALLEYEQALDAQLIGAAEPELPAAFLRRLNEVPLRAPQPRASWAWSWRNLRIPALSWAFAAVLGLGFGLTAEPLEEDDQAAEVSVAAVDSAAPDSVPPEDDFSALAQGTLTELEE